MEIARRRLLIVLAAFAAGCSAPPTFPQQDSSPDGRLLAEPRGAGVDLTTLPEGAPAGRLAGGHDAAVTATHFNVEGDRLVSGDRDGRIRVWDPREKTLVGELTGHRGAIHQFAVRAGVPDLASASEDGTIKLWDLKAEKEVRTLAGHRGGVLSLAVSADGRLLASGSRDQTVTLWTIDSGAELRALPHPGAVRALEFDGSGSRLAAGGDDGRIRLWDLKAGRMLHALEGSKGPILNLFFSGDGRWLLAYQSVGRETPISIWDTSTGDQAVADYRIEAALAPRSWPFRAVMEDVSRRALHR